MISVSIASGHENDRKAISALLKAYEDFRIESTGKDGYDALRSAIQYRPDVIVTDFSLGDIDSPDLAPIIKRYSPSTELIVLYSQNERNAPDKAIRAALKAGISGCLVKQDGFDSLVQSIRCVYCGGLYVSNQAKNYVLKFISEFETRGKIDNIFSPNGNIATGNTAAGITATGCIYKHKQFSPTEMQIFRGIAMGYSDGKIAKELNIHIGTLRNIVKRVKQETGLQSRTQIAIYALFYGIINAGKIWR